MPLAPGTLDSILKIGGQVAGAVHSQRQASGASASRQERIASCGRRPLFSKKKKRAYQDCLNKVANEKSAAANDAGGVAPGGYYPPEPEKSNTLLYVAIGLGVILLLGFGFIVIKKINN